MWVGQPTRDLVTVWSLQVRTAWFAPTVRSMPVEFLTDDEAAAYGRYAGPPSQADLERVFFLDDEDRKLVDLRRGGHMKAGFALQLVTVRWLGTFLEDPLDVPCGVLDFVAGQLGIANPAVVKRYTERAKTKLDHQQEIRRKYGLRDFADAEAELAGLASLGLACLAADTGDWHRAAVLHGAAQAFLDPTGQPWEELEARYRRDSLSQVRARLGQEQFERAHARGMALSLDKALDLASGRPPRLIIPRNISARYLTVSRRPTTTPRGYNSNASLLQSQGVAAPCARPCVDLGGGYPAVLSPLSPLAVPLLLKPRCRSSFGPRCSGPRGSPGAVCFPWSSRRSTDSQDRSAGGGVHRPLGSRARRTRRGAFLGEIAGQAPATRKRKRAAVASFCKWAVRHELGCPENAGPAI